MTMAPPRFDDDTGDDGDINAIKNHEVIPEIAQAHEDNGSNDHDHPNIMMDTVKMTTTEHHVHQEDKSTTHEELQSEYPFLIDENELFDESHHWGQQRRLHHHNHQHRRHSHPELRSVEQEVDGCIVKDYDHDSCTEATSSMKKSNDDVDGKALITAAATAPSIACDSTFASRPVLPTATATTPVGLTNTSTPVGLTNTSTIKSSSSRNNHNKISNKKKRSNSNIPLSSLPIDALQAISTYCTPSDWYSLSSTSQHWRYGIGSEVFGRVRRHAGLCAFEVGMAWAMGEHADARELAALYISKGVPIYPAPRGHAYHTLIWRMGLELSSSTTMEQNEMGDANPAQAVAASAAAVHDTEERMRIGSDEIDGDVNATEAIVLPSPTVDEFYSCLYLDGADGSNITNDDQRNVDAGMRRRPPNGRGRSRRRNLRNLLPSREQVLSLTYVEEKSLFWKRKKGIELEESTLTNIDTTPRRHPFAPQPLLAPLPDPPQQQQHPAAAAAPQAAPPVERESVGPIVAASTSSLLSSSSNSVPDLRSLLVEEDEALLEHDVSNIPRDDGSILPPPISSPSRHLMRATIMMHNEVVAPKMTMRVHRHLADQHFFGSPSVNDEKGTMTAGKMSMNADFFHPTWEGRKGVTTMYDKMNNLDGYCEEDDQVGVEGFGVIDEAHQLAFREPMESNVEWAMSNHGQARRLSLPILSNGRAHHPRSTARHSLLRCSAPRLASPASDVHLEIYTCSAANLKMDHERDSAIGAATSRMRLRCQHYQQRFDALLKNSFDAILFQEYLLDFWDEIFPTTAGIHFYNRQAAVPRMSLLHEFVMKPIPKALGTMECQIERVRITGKNSKAAAKRVKGRFFPKYEYRLFVRDTTSDNPFHHLPRKDSVLLVAKNKRGKNSINAFAMRDSSSHRGGNGVGGIDLATPAGLSSPSNGGTSKRGMSNYYLCLPQQCDVDNHYKSANRDSSSTDITQGEVESSSLDLSPLAMQNRHPIEVGRLQSNFIGTEFQIFLPNTVKAMQVEEQDAESECAHDDSDNQSMARRRSMSRKGGDLVRFAQRSFSISGRGISGRNSLSGNETADEPIDIDGSDESLHDREKKKKKVVRRMSWGTSPNPSKWTNRRAIANNNSSLRELSTSAHSSLYHAGILASGESEGGAITYTANLLGNRPRMMDVCIPKLMENGRVCDEWRKEQLTSIPNTVSMLDRFKNILYTLNSDEVDSAADGDTNGNQGLMLLQNRPPWWNVELGAFVLNFGGRVKVASVKNFQLCERNVQDHIMQFGRIEGRHAFTMDFQYPLSPLQAFAIAISSLQSKISFG